MDNILVNNIVFYFYLVYLSVRLHMIAKKSSFETPAFLSVTILSGVSEIVAENLKKYSFLYFLMYYPAVLLILSLALWIRAVRMKKSKEELKNIYKRLSMFIIEGGIVFAVLYTLTLRAGGSFF